VNFLVDTQIADIMSATLPALDPITPDNQGPAVILTAYLFIVIVIAFAIARVGSTFQMKRQFGLDDAFLVIAVVNIQPWVQTVLMEAITRMY
jgi:hypothetical protein